MSSTMSEDFLINLLNRHDIKTLYHVNTITTSCAYLRKEALLSRAYAENHGISQTPQNSDATDRELGIYDLIFLNFVDIHSQTNNICFYGSVSFELDPQIINQASEIHITKSNPFTNRPGWTNNSWDIYTESELDRINPLAFFGTFDHMIMLKTPNSKLNFFSDSVGQTLLKSITLDFPQLEREGDKLIYYDGVRKLIDRNIQNYQVRLRKCRINCKCHQSYIRNSSAYLRKFFQ